nr:uncharacterized protein LOC128687391 [Cherax quadricarinatus]
MTEDTALLVLWYRSSDTLPVYSYDAREGEFTSGVRWADEGLLGRRAFFMPTAEPPTLTLEPVHARDQGVYTCRVDYRLSPSTTAYVNLTVVIPSGPPMILWGGHGAVSVVGPLVEGERAHLTCRSIGGRPPPQLTWIRRGQRLSPLSYNATVDPSTGMYQVEAAVSIVGSRELLGSTLSCHARTPTHAHADLLQPQTASVVVNVTLSPVEVRVVGGGAGVRAGTILRLVCRAAGSHPPAHLTWWRAHARLPHVTHAVEAGGNVTTATLTMEVDRSHNGVTLACTAANPALPRAHHLTDTVKLNVLYPPIVHLSMGRPLDPGSIKEGDDVYFECNIVSNPAYQRVDWYHNGVLVGHNVTSGVVVSGLSLVLRHLRREHSGSYTCGAANPEGYNTSNAVTLSVRHTPVCAGEKRERTQGAARGSTAAVKCTVEAEPAHDLTWTWIRKRADGTEEEVPGEDVRSDGLTSSVLLTPSNPDDYGRFLCRAANAVGRQRAACVVNLVPAGPPDTPTNCSVAPIDSAAHAPTHTASLSITCIEGFDGGLPQHFTLETWQDGSPTSNMTSMFPEWVVSGLKAGVGVTLRVAAHNARGRSDVIRLEVHTASAQHHAAPDSEWGLLGVPPLLGVLVGVGGMLLILLVTGVVIAKYTWRSQPPTHVHTLVMTPTTSNPDADTYDPDVVSALRRPADNLDVLPPASYAHKAASAKSHAHRQAVVRTHAQGQGGARTHAQSVTKAYINRRGNGNRSLTRGFCLHRQDSPYHDSDSEESEDSDSDSTFTDLTAAGRAAASLPPAVMCSNSLPRRAKTEFHQLTSSPLDLQLHSCQRSQLVAASNGIIQRVPCFSRNPRRPLTESSEKLRHITSSAEELHPLIFSGDFRQLLSSGDLRHLSFSGTELRMMNSTGTWPPLSSSSGEMRLPLSSSATMQSLATEELRILPSSSSSSPWDTQTMSSFNQMLPCRQQLPSLPPCSGVQSQTCHEEQQHHLSCEALFSQLSQEKILPQKLHEEVQLRTPGSDLQSRSFYSKHEQHSTFLDPQTNPCNTESQPHPRYSELQKPPLFPQTLPATSSSEFCTLPICSEHQTAMSFIKPQPQPSCLKQKSLPPSLSYQEIEPTMSLLELQPPTPKEELQPLLPLVELQPPPSFRSPPSPREFCTALITDSCNLTPELHAGGMPSCSSVTCYSPASNKTVTSVTAPNDAQSLEHPSESETSISSNKSQHSLPKFSSMQKLVRFSEEKSTFSEGNHPYPCKNDKLGFTKNVPVSNLRPFTDILMKPVNSSHSIQDAQTPHKSITNQKANFHSSKASKSIGKQVSFSDDENLQEPVAVRVSAKSGVERGEKRCAQLFSSIDSSLPAQTKPQPPETAFIKEASCSPRRSIEVNNSPKQTTDLQRFPKASVASRLASGTLEKQKSHQEVNTLPSWGSPITTEGSRLLHRPVDPLGNTQGGVKQNFSERSVGSLKPEAVINSPRVLLKPAVLAKDIKLLDYSKYVLEILEKPCVPARTGRVQCQ